MRIARSGLVLSLLALLAAGAVVRAETGTETEFSARAFEVRHKPLSDAVDLVGEVLSDEGSVTLKPRLGVIVVEDWTAVLDRIAALLESFDVPPRNVEVTLSLYLGTRRKDESEVTRADRGIVDWPPLHFTEWSDYQTLVSRSVRGAEGDEIVAELSDDYRVIFVVDWVDDRLVKFEKVSLQQVGRDDAGVETVKNVYSMGVTVVPGRQTFVGTATGPDAPEALFLAVKASPR